MIPDSRSQTRVPIIREKVKPDNIIYTDAYKSYAVLDSSEFRHFRINNSQSFADMMNLINGIENFWSQAKRHLRQFNGIPRSHFHLFLKECEWRFYHSDTLFRLKQLKQWVRNEIA